MRTRRRKLVGVGLALGLWLTVAVDGAAVELVLWTGDDAPERRAAMDYVATAFMGLHDDAAVTIVPVNENEMAAELASTAAGPALINVGSELMSAFSADGRLDQRAATDTVIDIGRERFYPAALEMVGATTPGRLFAVPFHGWLQGIWYRRDWFDAAGLEAPTDWDRLLTAAERLHDPEAGRYGVLIGTEADAYGAQVFSQIALANDARLFGDAGAPAVTEEPMVEALAFYRKLAAFTPPGPNTPRGRDFFLQGQLAMMFYSTFIMDDLASAAAAANSLTGDHFAELAGTPFDVTLVDKVAMVPALARRGAATFGSINAIGVAAGLDAATRNLALTFLEFLFRPDIYVTWLHMAPGGMMPVLRDVATSEDFLRDPTGIFQRYGRDRIAAIIAGFDHIRTFSRSDGRFRPEASRAYAAGILGRLVQRAARGTDTPLNVARAAETELRQLLAE